MALIAVSDKFNRFIIAGDHLQTINGQKFVWENFLKELTDQSKEVAKHHAHIFTDPKTDFPTFHHLQGLSWTKDLIDKNVNQNHLTVNYRNHRDIVNFTRYYWDKWPSKKYTENSDNVDVDSKALNKMTSQHKEKDSDGSKRV